MAKIMLKTKIRDTSLSTRAINALETAKLVTVKQLVSTPWRTIKKIKNLGEGTFNEIVDFLKQYNLRLQDCCPYCGTLIEPSRSKREKQS